MCAFQKITTNRNICPDFFDPRLEGNGPSNANKFFSFKIVHDANVDLLDANLVDLAVIFIFIKNNKGKLFK